MHLRTWFLNKYSGEEKKMLGTIDENNSPEKLRSWKWCALETKDFWTKHNMIHVSSVTNIENKKWIQKHFVTICNN